MKALRYILFLLPLLLLTSCDEGGKESEMQYSFKVDNSSITMQVGSTAKIDIRNVIDGIAFGAYDINENKLGIKFTSTKPEIATVDEKGVITALANGNAKINVTSLSVKHFEVVDLKVGVVSDISEGALVTDLHTFTQDIGQKLTSDMVFLPAGIVRVCQGLDVDKDGNRYVSWESNGDVSITCIPAGSSKASEAMICKYGGHGDGFCVESTSDGAYVWTVGGLGDSGAYAGGKASTTDTRVVCRYKFQAGKTVYPEDAIDRFYINANGARCMSVDLEHNQFGIWTYTSTDALYFFNFDEVLSAPLKTLSIVRTDRKSETVTVHDLNQVKALGSFTWNRKTYCGVSDGSTNAVQGYCIYDGKAYILSGYKADEYSTISVVDTKGNWSVTRTAVGPSADKQTLMDLGVSGNGDWEPEGVQIHFGKMYLIYMGSGFSTAPTTRSSIIQLK